MYIINYTYLEGFHQKYRDIFSKCDLFTHTIEFFYLSLKIYPDQYTKVAGKAQGLTSS